MATSSQSRDFQTFNSCSSRPRPPSIKKIPSTSNDKPLMFGRIPYSALRKNTTTTVPSSPSSPVGIIKPVSMIPKRRSSTISLSNLLPRRKSLQTTALATRRQSLWMSIAKNGPSNNDIPPPPMFPIRQEHTSLMRKKFLRLLLVFSYLLSISILAIALATFYGVFWTGYITPQTTTIEDIKATVRSPISTTSNSTFIDRDSEIEDDSLIKSAS